MTWQSIVGSEFYISRTPDGANLSPGIYSHINFGHSDGGWLVLYSWLRLEKGLDQDASRAKAIELSTGCDGKISTDF